MSLHRGGRRLIRGRTPGQRGVEMEQRGAQRDRAQWLRALQECAPAGHPQSRAVQRRRGGEPEA